MKNIFAQNGEDTWSSFMVEKTVFIEWVYNCDSIKEVKHNFFIFFIDSALSI